MAFDGCKGRGKRSASTATTLWRPEIDSADVMKSLVCCPTDVELRFANYGEKIGFLSITADHVLGRQDHSARDKVQEQTTIETMKTECSIEDRQDYDVDSAMVEELNSSAMGISENGRQPNQEAVLFKDWGSPRSMEKNLRGLENMGRGMSMVSGFGGELDGFDLRMYSMSMHQAGKLPSAQYKGVLPQPNDRCGSQIYEKHQRVWLETFDREEDAAKPYDRAALKLRGRDAMTNLSPVRDCNPAEVNNAEASGLEGSGLKAHVCQENQGTVDAPANVSSAAAAAAKDMGCLPREHLFDKVLTPSDVGKLNRLVIPKQNAEKYFPLDGNSSEKGLLLNFEDDTRKVWRFRYSYWSSSQSYVLTKGWSGFVKNKTLETGDIISFHKGFGHSDQFYIRWRRKPSGQTGLGLNPHYKKSMAEAVYPIKGSSFLNPFNSCTQTPVVYNAAQWMPIIWPGSSIIPNSFTQFSSQSVSSLVNKIGHVATLRSQRSVAPLNSAIPVYFSAPPTKKTSQSRIYNNNSNGLQAMDLYLNLQMSLNSGDGRTNIKPVHPFVKPARPSTAQELETQEHKAASSLDPTAKKRVRLFGVTLAEPRNCEHSIMDS